MAWIKQVVGGELESSAKTPLKLIPEGKLTSVEQGLEYFRERKEQMSDTIWYTWNILGYGTIYLKHSRIWYDTLETFYKNTKLENLFIYVLYLF